MSVIVRMARFNPMWFFSLGVSEESCLSNPAWESGQATNENSTWVQCVANGHSVLHCWAIPTPFAKVYWSLWRSCRGCLMCDENDFCDYFWNDFFSCEDTSISEFKWSMIKMAGLVNNIKTVRVKKLGPFKNYMHLKTREICDTPCTLLLT